MSEPSTQPSVSAAPRSPQVAGLDRQRRRMARSADGASIWLHEEVARRLADKLDAILLKPARWLQWNPTLGGSAQPVIDRHPEAQHWLHETDPALRADVQARWQQRHPSVWWQPWKTAQAPVLHTGHTQAPAAFDLLWANMGLHAHPDPLVEFQAWHAALAVDGFLMCSGFGPDTLRELGGLHAAMGWGPATLQFTDMHDLGDALVKAGFQDPVMDMEHLTLTWPDADALLAELRTWGGNVAHGRFPGLRTPRWRQRWLEALTERLRGPDGRLALTVEVIYGHAVKPLPRALISAETRVSVDDFRSMARRNRPSST